MSPPHDRPSPDLPHYQVFALKYAERPARRADHFIGGDPHDEPMDMDYFVWVVRRTANPDGASTANDAQAGDGLWVIDTGFDAVDAEQRKRTLVRSVSQALETIGVDATEVSDVVVTHLHYDHIGGHAQFPNARFHLQDDEMEYATGRHMTQRAISHAYTADHIADLVHLVFQQRVVFHDGDTQLAPGLSVHRVGGHTKGLQIVRIATDIGWLVLASDASHYYENYETGRPFPIVYNLGEMLDGYRRCAELATDPRYVIPGHDPRVFDRYPPVSPDLAGIAARLDVEPSDV